MHEERKTGAKRVDLRDLRLGQRALFVETSGVRRVGSVRTAAGGPLVGRNTVVYGDGLTNYTLQARDTAEVWLLEAEPTTDGET